MTNLSTCADLVPREKVHFRKTSEDNAYGDVSLMFHLRQQQQQQQQQQQKQKQQ